MKVKHCVLALACAALLAVQASAQGAFRDAGLVKLWETKAGLKTPESVLFDPGANVIYVSNINEGPWLKDGNGFLSKLSPQGEIVALEWVKGLSAPKGMGVHGGRLYVTDVDELVEVDIAQALILKRYGHPQAQHLNDVAVGPDGAVYVSDSAGRAVYTLKQGKLEALIESDEVAKTNGLWVKDGELLCGRADRMVAVDLESKAVRPFVPDTGSIDGIAPVGDGSYVISDWGGKVQQVAPGKPGRVLLDTTPDKVNAADIDFVVKDRTLLVPTFFANKVMAYRLK